VIASKQVRQLLRRPSVVDIGGFFRGPSSYVLLLSLVGVLCLIGLVMVLSASQVAALVEKDSPWAYFQQHAVYVALGAVALVVASRIDFRFWRRFAMPLIGISVFLLVIVLIPGVGMNLNGTRSWIGLGPMSFQPAEMVKFALLVFTADLLARRSHRLRESRLTLRPVLLVLGLTGGLMMLQPDLGGTIIIGSIVVAVLFLAGIPIGRLSAVVAAGGAAAVTMALAAPYRRRRLLSFLDPSGDSDVSYHINQALVGIASGGIFGVGLGASRAKYGHLPYPHIDSIFVIIGEELGLLGALLVVAAFVGFAVLGVRVAVAAPDLFGTLMAGGITAWILVQAFINIGGVIGIMPITGVPLPFISYGGTSLITLMASSGVLLNIARQGRTRRPRPTAAEAVSVG
jgi:cell division protein FtsW